MGTLDREHARLRSCGEAGPWCGHGITGGSRLLHLGGAAGSYLGRYNALTGREIVLRISFDQEAIPGSLEGLKEGAIEPNRDPAGRIRSGEMPEGAFEHLRRAVNDKQLGVVDPVRDVPGYGRRWAADGSNAHFKPTKGASKVPEEIRPQANPVELWRQWYDTVLRMWANPPGGRVEEGSDRAANPYETWWRWTEATVETWRRAAETGTRITRLSVPRWTEMAEEVRKQMLDKGGFPADPLDFYTRWYNATSGPLSELADDILRDEAFLEYSKRLFDLYTTFDGIFRRLSEEYFGNLQLSTSSDVERMAGLIVALDDKVDRVEETLEELDQGQGESATAADALEERLDRLESRLDQLDRVESKLDQLLAAQNGAAEGGR